MGVVWGLIIVALALLCWGGQAVALFAPATAERLTLTEAEAAVDPAFYADVRGEALWDTLTLWTLLVAGLLLIFDAAAWPYFGLIGGATYVYFAGRGVAARRALQRRGVRIGSEASIQAAYVALPIWGAAGLVTLIAAVMALAD
jgi:hypothetical protein